MIVGERPRVYSSARGEALDWSTHSTSGTRDGGRLRRGRFAECLTPCSRGCLQADLELGATGR